MAVTVVTPSHPRVARRTLRAWPLILALLVGALTSLPYLYALATTPPDRVYTGLMLDAPDTLQYFSWLRDHRSGWLVSNRMTAQPNAPALFNLLWLALAQIQLLSGLSNAWIFQLVRLLGGTLFLSATWWLYGLCTRSRREQGWAWALTLCGGGLGAVWVVEKYLRDLPDVRYPFDLYVAEPNTLLSLLGYPHFLVAGGLMVAIFGSILQAARGGRRWWAVATVCALILALQHAYDLLTIYAVLGLWLALLTWKQRAVPWHIVRGAIVVGAVSFPPAGYFAWLTSQDPLWRAVLSQFTNAGVWTPSPPHLVLLLGVPLVLAPWGLGHLRVLRVRSDGELLIGAWAIAGLALSYLPVSFQIHLLNPLQVPLALLAVWTVARRVGPWLEQRRPAVARHALPALLLLTLPTNLYLVSWRFVELARHEAPYFLSAADAAALQWLAASTTRSDVVLSELELGQFVAADTDARAVLAHWAQTVDFYRTADDVTRALDPATAPAARLPLLRRYAVTFVLAREPLSDPNIVPVWRSGMTTIYQVRLEP